MRAAPGGGRRPGWIPGWTGGRTAGWIIVAALLAVAVFPRMTPNAYLLYVMSLAFINIISASGLNLIFGYAGQLNLAHAGFYTLGAYTAGILTADHQVPYWLAFVLAGVTTGVVGLLAGVVSLRLKGHYFAIFTLCVGFIIYLVIEKSQFTHAAVGIIDIPAPPSLGPLKFNQPATQYYLALLFALVSLWVMRRLTQSSFGRALTGIRTNEDLAQAVGVNLLRTKATAFVISTIYAGLAGALYAGVVRFLDPSLALANHNFELLAYILVGGAGTLYGPVLGVLALTWVVQLLGPLQDYSTLIYGPLLIVLVIRLPYGIAGLARAGSFKGLPHA
jgi:branched-chain amino acid transport system permease protein